MGLLKIISEIRRINAGSKKELIERIYANVGWHSFAVIIEFVNSGSDENSMWNFLSLDEDNEVDIRTREDIKNLIPLLEPNEILILNAQDHESKELELTKAYKYVKFIGNGYSVDTIFTMEKYNLISPIDHDD